MSKTRERILQAARKKFSSMGFYKTSVDEIAILAKKAKGSIYYYFTSKEELYKAVVNADVQILKTELEKILNSDYQIRGVL